MSSRTAEQAKRRRVTGSTPRAYIIGYALFVLMRCSLMFSDPKPIRTSTAVAAILFLLVVLLMLFLSYLRLEYGLLALGIYFVELLARETGIKWLFILEGTMAVILAALALRRNEFRQ